MAIIKRLAVSNLRNIDSANLDFSPQLNLIYGANGSGKTTLLEALSLLAHGRSFRSHLSTPLIKFGEKEASLFGGFDSEDEKLSSIGIQKHISKGSTIKLNSFKARSSSELAWAFPLLVVDGSTFGLIDGSSRIRRSLLDWLLFHVEHEFLPVYKEYKTCLKQRNAILRRGIIKGLELDTWTNKLASAGERLSGFRSAISKDIVSSFDSLLGDFSLPIEVSYSTGWKQDGSLLEALASIKDADLKAQTTTQGPHRADWIFTSNGKKLADVFSRGQKKRMLVLMHLAVIDVFKNLLNRKPVLALDDFPSELDKHSQQSLLSQVLVNVDQVFITAIEPDVVVNHLADTDCDLKVFHVEHGSIHIEETELSEQTIDDRRNRQ